MYGAYSRCRDGVTVAYAIWKSRQQASEVENEPIEDVRRTQIAATAGHEQAVQQAFENWNLRGRMRDPRGAGRLRIHRPPPESGGGTAR
jgi:hypothetical protein